MPVKGGPLAPTVLGEGGNFSVLNGIQTSVTSVQKKFLPFRGSASVGCGSKNSFLGSASFVCSPNHVSDNYF